MPGWLTRSLADVPDGDAWLSPAERRVAAGLRFERRRADWRLGRLTAKAAVGAWLGVAPERVEIVAAADGAPEALVDGAPAAVSVSLSHRAGRAIAAVDDAPRVVGCDIECVEPRSDAFLQDWLAPAEQALVSGASGEAARALAANLVWTAKEAAAKVRRAGLRLDVRQAVVVPAGEPAVDGAWHALRVEWRDRGPTPGWWRAEPGWVMTLAAEPAGDEPRRLAG